MEDLNIFRCFAIAFLIGGFAIFIFSIIKYCKKVITKIEQNEINIKRKKIEIMLKYNEKTEVTKEQFIALKKEADGICAFRTEEGNPIMILYDAKNKKQYVSEPTKYFVKLLMPKYSKYVSVIIKSN